MREELACEVSIGRLLWVIDNFFRYRAVDYHELGLYFVITCQRAARRRPAGRGLRQSWTGR
jgi:hypothetical protein